MKAYQYPIAITVGLAGLFVFFQNCGTSTNTKLSKSTAATSNTLTLVPSSATVAPNATLQLTGTGGTPPYTYSSVVGSGSITPYGLVTAPSTSGLIEFMVKDSTGAMAYSNVTVSNSGGSGGALVLTAQQPTVQVNGQLLFVPSGGQPNYQFFNMTTTCGSISPYGFFTAPATPCTVQIKVVDAAGSQATASATVVNTGSTTSSSSTGTTSTGGAVGGTPTSTNPYVFVSPGSSGSVDNGTWATSHLTDGSMTSCYSSLRYSTSYPSPAPYVLVHLAEKSNRAQGYTYAVKGIKIAQRLSGTNRVGWPRFYTIQVLNPDNSGYTTVGTFTNIPDFDGIARITFNQTYVTSEIIIIANTITTDGSLSDYYLQLCELLP